MSIDRVIALGARDDWLWIVENWTRLRAALVGSGGNALTGLPGAVMTSAQTVIDVHVSDLLEEITQSARFYGRVLLDEVVPLHGCNDACYADGIPADECPDIQRPVTTSFMPGLLADVAARYGHFVQDDEIGLAFCDDASGYREKVRKTLERPAPPTYVGPCQGKGEDGAGCTGELYVREGRDAGTCRECGAPFTVAEQREFLNAELEARLMTPTEIVRALKIIGHEVKPGTVYKWVQRGRLVEVSDGLYRLADAKVLMETKGGAA